MAQPLRTRIIKALASLKLAVVIMLTLGLLTAWGTIVESQYDAEAARKLVYDTALMYLALAALAVSLTAVMVDRWPWKKRHTAFVLAHIGILILLFGSVLSMRFGLDGLMTVEIGKESRYVVLPYETDVLVYASFGGAGMTKLHEVEVDFFRRPPSEANPLRLKVENSDIEIVDYKRYVLPRKQVLPAEGASGGPGVRIQVQNAAVNVIEWLVQRRPDRPAVHDFGPAKIHLGPTPPHGSGANEIYLTPEKTKLRWTLFRKDSMKAAASGLVEEGGVVRTGWMGLDLRILRFLPHARESWDFEERKTPTPLTTPAVKVRYQGSENWILMDDTLRLFTDSTAYLVSYIRRRIDLGFPLKLLNFEVIPYQGTDRAMEYKSRVILPNGLETDVSMNEPAEFAGLTFYQASFQKDEMGRPVASVFSINRDPGRWFKYLGSLILSIGVVWLFWSKRRKAKESAA